MCRKILALYDLCHDTRTRPSTCTPSRPVCSPQNDVYFGLQRCPNGTPCSEPALLPTVYLPLVARTCSDACEHELNPEYWAERQRLRRKEYNPFLDRMLCLGRDARLYHVVTGECVAGEEQFGDEPPVGRASYVDMLPKVEWGREVPPVEDVGEQRSVGVDVGRAGHAVVSSPSAVDTGGVSWGEDSRDRAVESGSESKNDCASSQTSRTSTWLDYRRHLRSLRERTSRGELRDGQSRPGNTSSPSWIGRRLVRSKSKRCLVSHES